MEPTAHGARAFGTLNPVPHAAVDATRYPSLAEYLGTLPAGLASYPLCQSKAGLVTLALEGHALQVAAMELPDPLRVVIQTPPPVSTWLPSVVADAVFHLVCDLYYPTDAQMLAWTHDRTLRGATSPMYRALAAVTSPSALIRLSARAHGLFQKGTHLNARMAGKSGRVVLAHPEHLHSPLNQLSNVAMFRALVEFTGGKAVRSEMTESTPTRAEYVLEWR